MTNLTAWMRVKLKGRKMKFKSSSNSITARVLSASMVTSVQSSSSFVGSVWEETAMGDQGRADYVRRKLMAIFRARTL